VNSLPAVAAPTTQGNAPSAVLMEAEKALNASKTHYTDRPGILPLREKVTQLLANGGLNIAPDAITITCGLIEGRFVALKQLVKAGGVVGTKPQHERLLIGATTLLGLSLVTDESAVALRYVEGAAELKEALYHPAEWIVCAYRDGEHYELPDEHPKRVLFIGEFEQLAGWRVGYMAGSSAANKLRAYKQSMTICTPSISQWAATGLEV
jgi:aspartate/methionine/tyrosine aminotransferase